MQALNQIAAAILLVSIACAPALATDAPPSPRQLKTWRLHNDPLSADLSPDETQVVIEATIRENTPDPAIVSFTDVVQLWNFKDDKLIAEAQLRKAEVHATARGYINDPFSRTTHHIRFSGDGSVIAAYVDHVLHAFRSNDLKPVMRIEIPGPPDTSSEYMGKTNSVHAELVAFELSPTRDLAAFLWSGGLHYSALELYELTFGKQIHQSIMPRQPSVMSLWGWSARNRLVWHSNGKLLFLSLPNNRSFESDRDIFTFDVHSGAIEEKLKTGLRQAVIAVTPDERLLAVDSAQMKVFTNRAPKLRVFDLKTGKLLRSLPGRGTGVRFSIAVSRNGERAIAFTGKMKPIVDWIDGVVVGANAVEATFSVWNLKTYECIATSQDVPGLGSSLRLSSNGNFGFAYGGRSGSYVFELP
jgi:WD40 repeat protein